MQREEAPSYGEWEDLNLALSVPIISFPFNPLPLQSKQRGSNFLTGDQPVRLLPLSLKK